MTTEIKNKNNASGNSSYINNYEIRRQIRELGNTEDYINKKKQSVTPLWKELLSLMIKIVSIILIFGLMLTFLFGIIRYQDSSMDPAIKDGDLVIFYRYNKSGYHPRDAVALDIDHKTQIRRGIATAGDTVDITEEGLLINGSLQQEPEIHEKTERYQDGIDFPITVPDGEVFILGDGRTGAEDSRIYGCVKIDDTLGKVMAVIRRRSI